MRQRAWRTVMRHYLREIASQMLPLSRSIPGNWSTTLMSAALGSTHPTMVAMQRVDLRSHHLRNNSVSKPITPLQLRFPLFYLVSYPPSQILWEERHLFLPLQFVSEYYHHVRVLSVQLRQLCNRLPRLLDVAVHILRNQTNTGVVGVAVVTHIPCEQDEAVRRDSGEASSVSRHVSRGIHEVERAVAVKVHRAIKRRKGGYDVVSRKVDERDVSVEWETLEGALGVGRVRVLENGFSPRADNDLGGGKRCRVAQMVPVDMTAKMISIKAIFETRALALK